MICTVIATRPKHRQSETAMERKGIQLNTSKLFPILAVLAVFTSLLTGSPQVHSSEAATNVAGGESPAWTFSLDTSNVGLAYLHAYDPERYGQEHYHIAGGLAIGDLNNDGWDDIFAVTGHSTNEFDENLNPNKLFISDGDGTFTESATNWGLSPADLHSAGPLIVDLNGDGFNDLLVGGVNILDSSTRKVRVYLNTGSSGFTDATQSSVLVPHIGSTLNMGMSAADIDDDEDLDLYVTHWSVSNPNMLFRNNGSAAFSEITNILTGQRPGKTFTPVFADINADGLTDLMISSDFLNRRDSGGGSRYFLNSGAGTFVQQGFPVPLPDEEPFDPYDGPDENGMGSAVADYDNDGDLDWFVSSIYDSDQVAEANWGVTGNRLYRNNGSGVFSDVTEATGVRNGHWGWGACFADFNNDMHLDLFHVNGFRPRQDEMEFANDPAVMFISDGQGGFTEQAAELGVDDTPYGRAILCFDNDRDGDMDILVNNNNSQSRFFRNNLDNGNHYILIKLRQGLPNHEAIGAIVRVTVGGVTQMRVVFAGANYASSHPTTQHFGLGPHTTIDQIEVTWPDGGVDTWSNVAVDQRLVLTRRTDMIYRDNFE